MATRTPWDPATGNVMTETRMESFAQGWLGYVEVTANQTVSTGTETDLTNLTLTITTTALRKLRLSAQGLFNRSVADGVSVARFKEGSTELGRFSQHSPSAATEFDLGVGAAIIAPTVGAHTYKCTIQRSTGTGNVVLTAAAGSPAWLLIEDIGPAS